MEIIKRKINLEDGISREEGPLYGSLTADSFYIKISLTQNMDDMGVYSNKVLADVNSSPDYSILINKLNGSGFTFPFMTGATSTPYSGDPTDIRISNTLLNDYIITGDMVTGSTDSKKDFFRTYNLSTPYIENFDIEKNSYTNPFNNLIDGRSRITEITSATTTYVFDANNDVNIGTSAQTSGLLYIDRENVRRNVSFDNFDITLDKVIGKTDFNFQSQGFNVTNISLSGIIKDEYLLGITESPKIENDIFIDRGSTSVFDKHMKLSGIFSIQQLEQFGNGEFNLIKQ